MIERKSIFVAALVLVILFIGYKIAFAVINITVDDANSRGVELYATAVKYALTEYAYKHGTFTDNVEELKINVLTKVECDEIKVSYNGKVDLYGCSVENSKQKYNYVDGKVEKE